MVEPILAENLTSLRGIKHGFFTRVGGASSGIYGGLNCGFGSDDTRERVTENRARVAGHLSAGAKRVITLYQVHSGNALAISDAPDPENLPKADAIVTTTRGLVIGVLTADCAPVLFADAAAGVVAAAHAGWRGAVGGILEATVLKMESAGATRESIQAAVGPCINQNNYEVGFEFMVELVAVSAENCRFFEQPAQAAKPYFDLPGYVGDRLSRLGVHYTGACAQCTYRNESLFYSFRRSSHRDEVDYGRQISAIVLE